MSGYTVPEWIFHQQRTESDYHVIFCFLLHVLSDESWPDRYLHVSDLHQWYGRCYGADADSP